MFVLKIRKWYACESLRKISYHEISKEVLIVPCTVVKYLGSS